MRKNEEIESKKVKKKFSNKKKQRKTWEDSEIAFWRETKEWSFRRKQKREGSLDLSPEYKWSKRALRSFFFLRNSNLERKRVNKQSINTEETTIYTFLLL